MDELDWLVGYAFKSLTRREHDWLLSFDGDVDVVIVCLWRLVEEGKVRIVNTDDGQRFGMPEPVNAAGEVIARLSRTRVEAVTLRETLDVELQFSSGHIFQIIPDSGGYESWIVQSKVGTHVVAMGGGELAVWPHSTPANGQEHRK